MDPDMVPGIAQQVAKFLVEGRFDELAQASKGVRLSAEAMRAAIEEMGGALVMPPARTWEELDIVAIRHRAGAYAVRFDLWTAKGPSDWTVELTLCSANGRPVIEVDDIHPL